MAIASNVPGGIVGLPSDPRGGLAAPTGTLGTFNGFTYLKVGSGNRDWVLLEGWQYVTLGANATTVSFTGLDGDKDVAYDIMTAIKFNSAAATIDVRPNSLTTNKRRTVMFSVTGGAPAAASATDWQVIDTATTGTHSLMRATLFARRGSGGRSIVTAGMEANGTTACTMINQSGIWDEDSTNITGIDFVSSVASGLGIGSMFMLRPWGLAR